jgi:hypothetical protein
VREDLSCTFQALTERMRVTVTGADKSSEARSRILAGCGYGYTDIKIMGTGQVTNLAVPTQLQP